MALAPASAPQPAAGDGAALLHASAVLAEALPALLVAAQRIASTVLQGVHGRRRAGQGDAFWQHRLYEPGDSAEKIDWRQSAAGDAVYVRETEWEAAASVWLWRDASASMRYASHKSLTHKRERADLLLLALASLLLDAGERVALLETGDRPATGRALLRRLAFRLGEQALVESAPSLPPLRSLPAHGHTVWIGDLLDPLDKIETLVRAYAGQGVRGHLVQILDPAEETLPFDGHVRFRGFEAEGEHTIRRVEGIREAYRARLMAQQEGLRRIAQSVGWSVHLHRTDKPPQTALLSLYMAMGDIALARGAAHGR